MISDVLIRRLAMGITLLCVALVTGTLVLVASPGLRTKLGVGAPAPASYAVGDRMDVPAPIYEGEPLTVLLFARSTCGTCLSAASTFASMLASVPPSARGRIRLVSTGANHGDEVAYAQRVGLGEADMQPLDTARLRLRVVPTLVLLDQGGIVRYASEGRPSPQQQDEFIRVIGTLAPAR